MKRIRGKKSVADKDDCGCNKAVKRTDPQRKKKSIRRKIKKTLK